MQETTIDAAGGRRRGRRAPGRPVGPERQRGYRRLSNPLPPVPVFTDDRTAAIHEAALRTLEELGLKVLLPEARRRFRAAGALVDDDSQMVRIGREIVAATLASAPREIALRGGGDGGRDLALALGRLAILPGGGAPHASDLERGRRPATLADYRDLTRLTHHFDCLHALNPTVEPQDEPVHLRHYAMTRAQLTLSDKPPVVFARGASQVRDCFAMVRDFRGLSDAGFKATPWCYTVINTNSPRQIDVAMAQGLIDFAEAGQLSMVTPFCLMGAMAPVTVAGALTLSHAEALAAVALTQLVRPGAPVCYGAFVSNVDMRSGTPAFGTPEQIKATLGAGQLARLIGLPWRSAAGCAANVNDAQAAQETVMSAWGAILAGCTVLIHGAGWMEGGLTVSFEKLITDLEAMQIFAELCAPVPADEAEIAYDAIAEVAPGGHFFAATHTMARYATAFYEPVVADWSNFGTWTERGSEDANSRAARIWRRILDEEPVFPADPDRVAALDAFIAGRTAQGGAPPES